MFLKINVRTVKSILFLTIILFAFSQCAKIVAPQGGPKDETPPVMLKSAPLPNALNFNEKKVVLTFDEYIKIPEINQKLIVSPPQEKPPKITQKGKSLELSFEEPFLENTTYTLYFSDAIADNNEGNKIPNFEFAFSTGNTIDSLTFSGKIVDAYSHEPQEGVIVMIYNSMEDSLPVTTRPRYVSKTNKEGKFTFSNLKEDDYKIFALVDMNSNYIFDQQSEAIAFKKKPVTHDMLLSPSKLFELSDSTKRDSLLRIDTTLLAKREEFSMRLFMEESRIQSLTDFSRKERRKIQFGFTRKPQGELAVRPLSNFQVDENWYIEERNLKGDTLTCWIKSSYLSGLDTLNVELTYSKTDSMENLVERIDTIKLVYKEPLLSIAQRRQQEKAKEESEIQTMPVKVSFPKGNSPKPNDRLRLVFNMPIESFDTTLLSIENLVDTSSIDSCQFVVDSLNPRILYVDYPWQSNVNYKFNALPGTFVNLDGLPNDTLRLYFTGADPEQFGILNLNLTNVIPNVIVELLTDKGIFVERKIVSTDGIVTFNYVTPGKYYFRFIIDSNKNGVWDTGWYKKGIQPEIVLIFEENGSPKISTVRAFWEYDLEYSFNLENLE